MGWIMIKDLVDNFLEQINKDIFWVDEDCRIWKSDEINDTDLKDILYLVSIGGGCKQFLTRNKLNALYEEGYKRTLLRPDVILALHSWALYTHGFTQDRPRYLVTLSGKYLKVK